MNKLFLINIFPAITFAHASDKVDIFDECIGRLTVTFPYEVQVAGASFDDLKKQISEPNFDPRYSFSDGQISWSSKIFYMGPILVSNELGVQKILSLKKLFIEKRKNYIEKKNEINRSDIGEIFELSKNTVAWNSGSMVRAFTSFDNGVMINFFSKNENLSKNISLAENFSKNIKYRRTFEMPSGPGLCFPHAFIKTSVFGERGVRASYKLLKYPDITVWISDKSSTLELNNVRRSNNQPKSVINNFWAQYGIQKGVRNIEPMLSEKNGASVSLAGKQGIASFVKIERDGGVEDYGYYAAARGEPGNEDAPDIDIYVIRNSSFAGSNGPASQEEFLHIVEVIQTSLTVKKN